MNDIKFNQRALHELLQSEQGPVAKELYKTGLKVEAAAKRLTPVDTGRARASIDTVLGSDSKGLYAKIAGHTNYFIFLELGTRFMRAFAPLRRALREVFGR